MSSGGFVPQSNQLVHPNMHFNTTNISMLAMQWGGSPRWEGNEACFLPLAFRSMTMTMTAAPA
jgi:hypothetical protein